jgi:hypothetical protein
MDNPEETVYMNVGRPCSCTEIKGMKKGKNLRCSYPKLDQVREEEGDHPDD